MMPAFSTSLRMCFASATVRPSGFSHAMPLSVALPDVTAAQTSSTFSIRAWFGPFNQIASILGSHTISVIDLYALQFPTSSSRAYFAADAAFFALGLHTPRTSASRTCRKPCM